MTTKINPKPLEGFLVYGKVNLPLHDIEGHHSIRLHLNQTWGLPRDTFIVGTSSPNETYWSDRYLYVSVSSTEVINPLTLVCDHNKYVFRGHVKKSSVEISEDDSYTKLLSSFHAYVDNDHGRVLSFKVVTFQRVTSEKLAVAIECTTIDKEYNTQTLLLIPKDSLLGQCVAQHKWDHPFYIFKASDQKKRDETAVSVIVHQTTVEKDYKGSLYDIVPPTDLSMSGINLLAALWHFNYHYQSPKLSEWVVTQISKKG